MTLKEELQTYLNKDINNSTLKEIYDALIILSRERMKTQNIITGKRKVYYISAEFLIGKMLSNNLINLGIYNDVKDTLQAEGISLADIEELEAEPSLGNGGLGRLAACFLDSLATLKIPSAGIGLNYHEGLFQQFFKDHKQDEEPNPWISNTPWLKETDCHFTVPFKDFTLISTCKDIDILGYNGGKIPLHLFDLDSVEESVIGEGIAFDKTDIKKNLTLFLYPDDSDDDGRKLRIFQQYFMVSNAAQLILKECTEAGFALNQLDQFAAIQINDTHPSMVIPELIRLLMANGIDFDEAACIVTRTCAYTNHTILAEALETWPMDYLEAVVPLLVPIIRKLDALAKERFTDSKVAIIDKNARVHMAHMDMHFGHSINGVAALHTEILKKSELKPFYDIYPEKFNNKTNGITFRRWLMGCNPELSDWISSKIGDDWKKDASLLSELKKYADDSVSIDELQRIKQKRKVAFAEYLLKTQGIKVDPTSVFDVQVKRLHEYKRQQMNALYAIYKYKQIKAGYIPEKPLTMIFGAKAAPAYTLAKDIIHLILCLSELVNNDPDVNKYFKIVMIENYNVTKAEKLIPAADISEQISLASKEASGTSNMKFMLNGAVTLGTLDGANVEIADLVGQENIYLFGKHSDTVIDLYAKQGYVSRNYYESNPVIKDLVDFIVSDKLLSIGDSTNLNRLYNELLNKDWFMTLLDLEDYIHVKEHMLIDMQETSNFGRKMIINIANAGFFSSDRTIAEYNQDIWHV